MSWIDAIGTLRRKNEAFVLVTILNVDGSAPRGPQTKMIITGENIFDSIGGGNLEFQAMEKARELLAQNQPNIESKEYTLGQDLTQCCGGRVKLLFECFPSCDFQVVLCGAGHVGKALVKILAELPCQVNWLDARSGLLFESYAELGSPSNVTPHAIENPYRAIEQCLPSSFYLIMTHSHETDFEYCEAILARNDIRFCGLIGSKSKAVKFRKRLGQKGFSPGELNRLTSPIGLDIGAGKHPMEVAIATAAQLMQIANGDGKKEAEGSRQGLEVVANVAIK